jgi:hypothetical protein
MRRFVLAVFLIALTGTSAELLLLEHTDGYWQLLPLMLSAISLILLSWRAVDSRPFVLRAFRATMILFVLSGIVGVWLHYRGNVEFELEMYPSLDGFALFWKSLKGATPTLAAGTMLALGLLGFAYTYKYTEAEKGSRCRQPHAA